jgi:poly(3-hydroxyalkanoate) synthetase
LTTTARRSFTDEFKREEFERSYKRSIDPPGKFYFQAIQHLFKNYDFCKGKFVTLGCKIRMRNITCPTFLVVGEGDDITPLDSQTKCNTGMVRSCDGQALWTARC